MGELRAYAVNLLNASSGPPVCKVCHGRTTTFDLVDFNKTGHAQKYPYGIVGIPVLYYRCELCDFIFTDFLDGFSDQQWLDYVYNGEYYATVDPEYAEIRPMNNSIYISSLLAGKRSAVIGLDFGGGNGKTAELMRDAGWSYDCWDPFGHTDMTPELIGNYNFCSSVEVFEHTPDPVGSLDSMIAKCTSDELIIMVGTRVHDNVVTDELRLNWWYAAPRNGHISLHSRKSLGMLGAKFGLTYVSLAQGTHLLVRGHTKREMQSMLVSAKLRTKARSVLKR